MGFVIPITYRQSIPVAYRFHTAARYVSSYRFHTDFMQISYRYHTGLIWYEAVPHTRLIQYDIGMNPVLTSFRVNRAASYR